MRRYGFGSYLNGGGAFSNNDKHATSTDWIALAEAMYQASVDDARDGSIIPTTWMKCITPLSAHRVGTAKLCKVVN